VSPVTYELGFYIPEDGILHSHSRETPNLACVYNSFCDGLAENKLFTVVRKRADLHSLDVLWKLIGHGEFSRQGDHR
jgi:hypothetical protein